jgi:hypothetical protein
MKKAIYVLPVVAAVVLLHGAVGYAVHGQAAATTHMGNPKITQGDNMSVDVTLDQGANLDGSVYVQAFPDGSTDNGVGLGCGVEASQTKCQAGARMPLDAKLGKWVIAKITFTPVSGQPKVLTEHGDASFEVVPHSGIVLPDSATISNIK